ncbi:hypothetical protein KC19_3G262900 [Ceratodon purpureus]|uniref:GATA-type domain-containing protein n=1 Tax=Ceratodon purpureus TaxID=3225 RepID=A0A8T0IQS8_CERPU|nr:hypothetical protein KC19_3G262900 [Ceratodon purpureus]
MASSFLVAAPYGLLEVDKMAVPEAFHIDDLLDFSCEDIGGPIVGGELELSGVTVESCVSAGETSISSSLEVRSELLETALDDIEVKADLCVPCDDLADLEWLSSFVEDSFAVVDIPEVSSTYGSFPSAISNNERTPNMKLCNAYQPYQKSSPVSVLENSPTSSELTGPDYRDVSVPGRARSKRSRTGARIWTSKILPTSSSVNSFESMGGDSYAMSYSPIGSEENGSGECTVDAVDQDDEDSQSSKRYKVTNGYQESYNTGSVNNNSSKGRKKNQDNAQAWRCMHCQTQRTPQWRTGPMGPKTLCNACGVRYKSGRLLPEYRPAGSPTYVASKHSHSHKKVIEMRRERELRGHSQAQGGHQLHPQSVHGATPLREKTNNVKEQGVKSSSLEHVKSEYQCDGSKSLEMSKCFSKPLELTRTGKLELPKYGSNSSAAALEFSKCLTSTSAVLEPRLEFGLDDTRGL